MLHKRACFILILGLILGGCGGGGSQVRKESALVTHVDIAGALFVNPIEDLTSGRMLDPKIASEIQNAIIERINKGGKYKLSNTQKNAEYILNIKMLEFTAGNRALRFWVGCGAGAAKLHFVCELIDKEGKVLDSQDFQRFGAGSLRSGPVIINQMKNLTIDYACAWLKL